jgi:hypothetical protein
MLEHGRQGDGVRRREFTDRGLSGSKALEHRSPNGIAQCRERVVERILYHMV